MVTQQEIILEYFKNNPNRKIATSEIVDWAVLEYEKRTEKKFRDPDRSIRKLHEEGKLIKLKKGLYIFDSKMMDIKTSEEFSPTQKKKVMKRDDYKCVICGRTAKEGYELHVDHIKSRKFGGKATLENAQTLCSLHNMRKKTYDQTETGKRMFIRLLKLAEKNEDLKLTEFCEDVLKTYEIHTINSHIKWEK